MQDYYALMGVAEDASPDEIKKAYRRLARKYHPDVSSAPDAEEKFKQVGIDITTLGLDAGTGLTAGPSNTLIGAYAGEALTTQISNTAVGTYD